jgi:hypothetical protein
VGGVFLQVLCGESACALAVVRGGCLARGGLVFAALLPERFSLGSQGKYLLTPRRQNHEPPNVGQMTREKPVLDLLLM